MEATKLTNLDIAESFKAKDIEVTGEIKGIANGITIESKSIANDATVKYIPGKVYLVTATAASKTLTMSDIPENTGFIIQNVGETNSFTLKHTSSDTGVTIAAESLYFVTLCDSDNELEITKIN